MACSAFVNCGNGPVYQYRVATRVRRARMTMTDSSVPGTVVIAGGSISNSGSCATLVLAIPSCGRLSKKVLPDHGQGQRRLRRHGCDLRCGARHGELPSDGDGGGGYANTKPACCYVQCTGVRRRKYASQVQARYRHERLTLDDHQQAPLRRWQEQELPGGGNAGDTSYEMVHVTSDEALSASTVLHNRGAASDVKFFRGSRYARRRARKRR